MAQKKIRIKPPIMIQIPAGSVTLGTSEDQVLDLLEREDWAEEWEARDMFKVEQPQHTISLPAFEIAQFPVINSD